MSYLIHGKSNHPVFVKKININLWTLRDEIEALIAEKMQEKGLNDPSQLSDEDISAIKSFYQNIDSPDHSNVIQLVKKEEPNFQGEVIDDNVDEMMKAMQEEGVTNSKMEEIQKAKEAETIAATEVAAATEEVAAAEATPALNQDDINALLEGNPVEEKKLEEATKTAPINKNNTPFRRKPSLLKEESVSTGVTLLADVHMESILCFSKYPFEYGQSIIIEFLIPNYFVASAEVISCSKYNLKSRIINPNRPEYRIQAKFTFQTKGERTLLRNFLKSVEPDIPAPKKKKQEKSGDDLADLGL